MLLGYWPPTGTDWMLAEYADGGKDVGYYHVAAYSPTFGQPLGWEYYDGFPPDTLVPWWGTGSGHPLVDFRDTANFFWVNLNVPLKNPIAIMSFSRGLLDVKWNMEPTAYNYANADWEASLYQLYHEKYYPLPTPIYPPAWQSGSFSGTPTNVPDQSPPYIGGGTGDPSPRKHDTPQTGGPPDPSMSAGASRSSNLPTGDIKSAINAAISASKVNPTTSDGGLGKYVSAYMAYLVNWYGQDPGVQPANAAIKQYGHTHVGAKIQPSDAKIALNAQVNALISWLDSH